jgi:hypothetical protein
MKNKTYIILLICHVFLTFNACKEDCPEDTVINYPLYTEHKIFTNYDLGDSICFVSENLDTAKLFLVKMDTFTDQSISNTDIDCGTHTLYTTSKLRCFWKGSGELLNEIRIVTFHSEGFPKNEFEFIGRSWFEFGMTGAYYPFPHLAAKYYDSLLMGSNYYIGIKFEAPLVVLLFNSREGVLKINYRGRLWKRAF